MIPSLPLLLCVHTVKRQLQPGSFERVWVPVLRDWPYHITRGLFSSNNTALCFIGKSVKYVTDAGEKMFVCYTSLLLYIWNLTKKKKGVLSFGLKNIHNFCPGSFAQKGCKPLR